MARRFDVLFIDREDAGRRLATTLTHLRGSPLVVAGLPRGGVPVALHVALELGAPLDVIVVRKLGVPFQPELAMGAVGEGGTMVINEEVVRAARVKAEELNKVATREIAELERRVRCFRGDGERVSFVGKTVLIVDDGIATGSTARAACRVARALGAERVVLAVPLGPSGWDRGDDADEYSCLEEPEDFVGVGRHYGDFRPTTDEEVVRCLLRAVRE